MSAPAASGEDTSTSPLARAGQLAGQATAPIRRSMRGGTGGAALMLAATIFALLWANSPWGETYDAFWHTELGITVGDATLSLDLQHWVNDGLMVFFFFVVGLEVKRELVVGELRDRRRAAVPFVAALLGLVVPALVYLAFNPSGEAAGAWGVVISTDTAFVLGVLALVGPACPAPLRVFLLTLAVADDVGALTVIALAYTDDLALMPLALAAAGIGLMVVLRYLRVWRGPIYLVIGIGVWIAMEASGVHPTIAGVVIGLLAVADPPRREDVVAAAAAVRAYRQSPSAEFGRAARFAIDRSTIGAERMQLLWGPWSTYVIVPIFAVANAGVVLDAEVLAEAARSPVTIGIVVALVAGKLVGVTLGALGAVALRVGRLSAGVSRLQVVGGAALSGIGFTISLFIVDLAFEDEALADQARIGVLAASLLAALVGWAVFRLAARRGDTGADHLPTQLAEPVDPRRDHIRGPVDAELTLVEYGDFECPFCGRATGAVADVRKHFGDRLRYVYRHLPLVDTHAHAFAAAQASEAAAAQGRFWEYHDALFADQDALEPADLLRRAETLGLDVDRFARDLASGEHEDRVREDLDSADAGGARATPTFYIGGDRHTGATDARTLVAALEAAATRAGQVPAGR